MSYLDTGAMFAEENAARRAELDRQHAEDLEHEQHITNLLAAKDAEVEHLRDAARAFRGLLWRLQDAGDLPSWAITELGRLESLYDTTIDEDES